MFGLPRSLLNPAAGDSYTYLPHTDERIRADGNCSCVGQTWSAAGVWTFSAGLHPERMPSLSPGLRAARYPGSLMHGYILP